LFNPEKTTLTKHAAQSGHGSTGIAVDTANM